MKHKINKSVNKRKRTKPRRDKAVSRPVKVWMFKDKVFGLLYEHSIADKSGAKIFWHHQLRNKHGKLVQVEIREVGNGNSKRKV